MHDRFLKKGYGPFFKDHRKKGPYPFFAPGPYFAFSFTMGPPIQPGLTQDEMRERVIRLVFGGSRQRYDEFCQVLRNAVPGGTTAVVRGSCVTGERWNDGAPFDSEGPGTSDMDLTLVGSEILSRYKLTGFFVPGVHSRPISEDDPDIAPELNGLRDRLIAMAGRPVNIQASRDIVMYLRGDLLGQPYLVLFEKPQEP